MLDNVHHKRGFTHRRTCCDDKHIWSLQAIDHPIEFSVACRHPRDPSVTRQKFLKIDHDFADGRLHIHLFGCFAGFSNFKHLLLYAVEEFLDIFGIIVSCRDRLGARFDDVAENEFFFYDREMRIEVCGGGGEGVDFSDSGGSANTIEKVTIHEVLGQGN